MKNLNQMMKQAQQLQTQMAEMQKKMDSVEVEGASGAGMIKVVISGKSEMKKITIDPSLIDPKETEILEDLIIAAFNDAKTKLEAHISEEMGKVSGSLNLPGGFKLPF